ncbi:MAG: adenylate kinase [Chloroflexi bacterium]|nr:MAG: adenylate kinase [Chloroflexota bacterium]TMF15506.1 MAG: adenylate kinase [Chloroflexota bacterium]
MIVVLFGPPGSGKGTQSIRVARHLRVPHVATGDMLRAEVARGSALGREAEPLMSTGRLVPDDLIVRMIGARINEPDAAGGALLDGFPRTVPQAKALDAMLGARSLRVDVVVSLRVDDDELRRRVLDRAKIEGRADDTPEAFEQRLRTYGVETAPVLDYYRGMGTRIVEVDGVGEIENITRRITVAIAASGTVVPAK